MIEPLVAAPIRAHPDGAVRREIGAEAAQRMAKDPDPAAERVGEMAEVEAVAGECVTGETAANAVRDASAAVGANRIGRRPS